MITQAPRSPPVSRLCLEYPVGLWFDGNRRPIVLFAPPLYVVMPLPCKILHSIPPATRAPTQSPWSGACFLLLWESQSALGSLM